MGEEPTAEGKPKTSCNLQDLLVLKGLPSSRLWQAGPRGAENQGPAQGLRAGIFEASELLTRCVMS